MNVIKLSNNDHHESIAHEFNFCLPLCSLTLMSSVVLYKSFFNCKLSNGTKGIHQMGKMYRAHLSPLRIQTSQNNSGE